METYMLSLSLNLLLKERAWDWNSNGITSLLCACLAPIKNILCLPPSVYLSVKQILVAISQDLKQKTSDPQWILNSYHWTWQRHKSLKQKSFLHIYSQVSIMLRKKIDREIRKMKMQTQRAVKVTQMLLILIYSTLQVTCSIRCRCWL